MKFIGFLFREGSSILFAGYLLFLAFMTPEGGILGHNMDGLFVTTLISLAYLGLQMALAAFVRVGQDKPLLDLFFSLFPVFALFAIGIFFALGQLSLTSFHIYALVIAGVASLFDVVFNTQVVFKMNRLANDMVTMR